MPKRTRAIKRTDQEKPWNKRKLGNQSPYAQESRALRKVFLIICEGENTEPSYFKSFPLGNAEVKSYGTGTSKTALVEYVIKVLEEDEYSNQMEVWVVFDFDEQLDKLSQQKNDFNQAIQLANNKGIKVAYSIDSFELWFLLHYVNLESKWTRKEYYQKLSDLWNCNYQKQGKSITFCRKIYQILLSDEKSSQDKAIQRAKMLEIKQKGLPYADRNPSTSVYVLVEALNEYLE